VGGPEDIYHRPASRLVAEFLGRCNSVAAKVVEAASPSAGTARLVMTANGKPVTVSGDGLAAGDLVQLAVRPEAVELVGPEAAQTSAQASARAENTYRAELRDVSFLGDRYLYELDVDGLALMVTSTRSIDGHAVLLRIPPSACRVLPA
jgi:ABC-type Fe3+/spermidine/putrescine transport system ATPase subunit